MNKTGLIHIYCGDGKGKTTAATGLAIRAAGSGRKVLFARFMKNENSCELKVLDQIEGIKVIHLERSFGFYSTLNDEERVQMKETYHALWNRIMEEVDTGTYQMLVMDELMSAYHYEVVPCEEVIHFLQKKPEELEVVMTGRDPAQELLDIADYVSEIQKIKHPFDKGINARKGIEF